MAIEVQTIEGMVDRLVRHQAALGLSDAAFTQQYQEFIGSDRTWRHRIITWRNGDEKARAEIKDFDVQKWGRKMQALVMRLDGQKAQLSRFFWGMPFTTMVVRLVNQLEQQATDRRNLYVLATTGVGKSVVALALVEQKKSQRIYCRLHADCRNREKKILLRMARALAIFDVEKPGQLFDAVSEKLKLNPVTMFIDEAHEGGTVLMKILKTLIDESPARFVQFAYPTEYDRVKTATAGAMDEAKQLLGRTMKPIYDAYRDGLGAEDVIAFLRSSVLSEEGARDITPRILGLVRANGNLRVLEDAVADSIMISETHGIPLDAAMVRSAVEAQCPAPVRRETR
jgi:hypothetical protein